MRVLCCSAPRTQYFYWMFESRNDPKTDPLVLWLTGGPGCSGMLALLNENGPCSIKKDPSTGALSEVNNPYSWTNNANVNVYRLRAPLEQCAACQQCAACLPDSGVRVVRNKCNVRDGQMQCPRWPAWLIV